MRIRTVKPEFWAHRMHQVLSEPAALLALALLNLADDEGRFEAHPRMIESRLFVYRKTSKPVEDCLQELVKVGFVGLYSAELDGLTVELGVVRNFLRHQVISRATKSTLPAPPHGLVNEDSMSAHERVYGRLNEDSIGKEGRKEGSREGKKEESTRARGDADAVIPTVAEVVDFGRGPAGIPEDFCRHFHRKKEIEGTAAWLTRNGDLRKWRLEIADWWKKDRATWGLTKKRGGAEKENGPEKSALVKRLEDTNDPKERLELLKQVAS